MQRCTECHWSLSADVDVCPNCGHPVEEDKDRRRINLRWHITSMIPTIRHSRQTVGTGNQSAGRAATILTATILVTLLIANVALAIALWPRSSSAELFTANPTYLTGQLEVGKKAIFSEIVRTSSSAVLNCRVPSKDASWLTCVFSFATDLPNHLHELTYNIVADASRLQPNYYQATITLNNEGKEVRVIVGLKVVVQVLPAHLTINPTSLNFGTLQSDQKVAQIITISNTGGKDLTWSQDSINISWLIFDKMSGTIAAGKPPQVVTAHINTTGLQGQIMTTVRFTSNSNTVTLPVRVNVVPLPGSTPTLMPVTTPEITPESTPATTPVTTPEITPETTPVTTPETTPVTTPDSTPVIQIGRVPPNDLSG